jgi:hypothetical protein
VTAWSKTPDTLADCSSSTVGVGGGPAGWTGAGGAFSPQPVSTIAAVNMPSGMKSDGNGFKRMSDPPGALALAAAILAVSPHRWAP